MSLAGGGSRRRKFSRSARATGERMRRGPWVPPPRKKSQTLAKIRFHTKVALQNGRAGLCRGAESHVQHADWAIDDLPVPQRMKAMRVLHSAVKKIKKQCGNLLVGRSR